MPSRQISSVENNFTKGLVTEFTGLNFPENAATDTDNCEYTLVGDVIRREGIDIEVNAALFASSLNNAKNSYVWSNVGGDGNTKYLVNQEGTNLRFFSISAATNAAPLSTKLQATVIDISTFVALGGSFDSTLECQFTDGNGYLIVFHPSCDPFYITFTTGTLIANRIIIQIRDFVGVSDDLADNARPNLLSQSHNYNLLNQGWTAGNPWQSFSSSVITVGLGSRTFTIDSGLTITPGNEVTISSIPTFGFPWGGPIMSGNVTSYSGSTLVVNVTSGSSSLFGQTGNSWSLVPRDTAYIDTWATAIGNYPSNADVWWYFKNSSGVFDPGTTNSNVSIGLGKAPRGHFLLDAFNQQRDTASGISVIGDMVTTVRPRTGCWFQGRVWYTGVDAQHASVNTTAAYSWTENIYFSQIITETSGFGKCYQTNDPTSEQLFDLLPTDGGIINIQGCGSIYRLFPIQNGLLVFATNGIWFVTGSQGIGFSAVDYTLTKISSVQSISGTSFVNVQGLPYFWNEEGIYAVEPSKEGGLIVNPITVGTILQFFNEIPFNSKKFVRGAYNPIDYVIQWTYRNTNETGISDRYHYNSILNYNTYNKAFFPYTVGSNGIASITGINYISYPQIGANTPDPGFKYGVQYSNNTVTFGDEHDTNYVDWASSGAVNYGSFFVTGFKLHGQGQRRFQVPYIYTFSKADTDTAFYIQGLWDYATDRNSNRWSTKQYITTSSGNFGMVFKRTRIRGQGLVLQIKVSSVDGQPFDLMGWSIYETQNSGV